MRSRVVTNACHSRYYAIVSLVTVLSRCLDDHRKVRKFFSGVCGVALYASIVYSGPAVAEVFDMRLEAPAPTRPSVHDRVDFLSQTVAEHISNLSLDTMSMGFDSRRRKMWLGMDAGTPETLRLRINADVQFVRGYARVSTQIRLGSHGSEIHLRLPDIDLVPRSIAGKRTLEVRLPLIRGYF